MATPVLAGTRFRLPDFLRRWPRIINPHYAEVKAASASWLDSFHAFTPETQETFNRCDFNLLAALAYPTAEKAHLRTACDYMNIVFLLDEFSDTADGETAQMLADISSGALRNPHKPRPSGECILGEITRQYWELAIKTASEPSQRRLLRTYEACAWSMAEQARDRDQRRVYDLAGYLEHRRENVGTKSSFAIIELGLNLPDEVMGHCDVAALTDWCTDMVILANDVFSYNVEQARGDGDYNLVSVVMREFGLDIQGAVDWIARENDKLVDKFLTAYQTLPSWGPDIDAQLACYVDGLGKWVRANEVWSYEAPRYLGPKGLEIKKDRWLTLLPPGGTYTLDAPNAAVDQRGSRSALEDSIPVPSRRVEVCR